MQSILFLTLLATAMSKPVDTLSGQYWNQLNSSLVLACSNNQLTGTYQTGVGNASGTYPLQGSTTQCQAPASFGFCVAWNNKEHGNSHSVTCWSGRVIEHGLDTFWILSSDSGPQWSSNRLGQDIFWKSRDGQ